MRIAVFALALLPAVDGCAGNPEPAALPPLTVSESASPPTTDPTPAATRAEAPASVRLPSAEPIVIDAGEEDDPGSRSPVEAAQAERRRRERTEAPVHVITNDNLADHATGDLTLAAAGAEEAAPNAAPKGAPDPQAAVRTEAHWRSTLRDARLHWREAWDKIAELEERAASLRRRFYTEDDPWVRDTRIKPELDRTSAELALARAETETARATVDTLLEEGRRSGALPGWLREGVEFEPPVEDDRTEGEPAQGAEPREPTIVDETGGGGE